MAGSRDINFKLGEVTDWRDLEVLRQGGSHSLMVAYLKDVGNHPLLSAEEEAHWARQYSSSRQEIRDLLQQHPQVIMEQLRVLRDDPKRKNLTTLLCFTQNPEGTVDEEEDLGDEESLRALDNETLNAILDDPKQSVLEGSREKYGEALRRTAEIIAPYLRAKGKIHFKMRFLSDCVQTFVRGEWEEPGLSAEEKQAVCKQMSEAARREQEAMNVLVEGNLRLVISVAKHFPSRLLSFPDIIQEGNIGLMRAIETFDWERGHRLSTFACYRIRHAISMALNAKGRSIRIPVNILRQLTLIRQAEQDYIQETGKEPTDEKLAELTGLTIPRLRALRRMVQQPLSLQAISSEDRDWNELLRAPTDPGEERRDREGLQEVMAVALKELRPNERDILERHFGLNGKPVQSLDGIAAHYGLTSERIRQIEAVALQRLRVVIRKAGEAH